MSNLQAIKPIADKGGCGKWIWYSIVGENIRTHPNYLIVLEDGKYEKGEASTNELISRNEKNQ